MLDQLYEDKAEKDRVRQQAQDLKRFVNNELKKNKRKLNIQKKTLKRAKDAEKYQRLGELLTLHMHLVSNEDTEVTLIAYYVPEEKEITIPLKTDHTPGENDKTCLTSYSNHNNS